MSLGPVMLRVLGSEGFHPCNLFILRREDYETQIHYANEQVCWFGLSRSYGSGLSRGGRDAGDRRDSLPTDDAGPEWVYRYRRIYGGRDGERLPAPRHPRRHRSL